MLKITHEKISAAVAAAGNTRCRMRAELKSPTSITRGSVTTTTRQLNRSRSSETAAPPHQFPQGHTHKSCRHVLREGGGGEFCVGGQSCALYAPSYS